jgi:hypothetical protein
MVELGSKKIFSKVTKFTFLLCFLWLTACPRVWHFTITDVRDPKYPSFCVSRFDNCEGHAISFSVFDIDEVDEKGEFIRAMWELRPIENKAIKVLVYGTPPEGYKEVEKAVPLEIRKFYRVHGQFFFRLIESDKEVKGQVYSYEEFDKKFKLGR